MLSFALVTQILKTNAEMLLPTALTMLPHYVSISFCTQISKQLLNGQRPMRRFLIEASLLKTYLILNVHQN